MFTTYKLHVHLREVINVEKKSVENLYTLGVGGFKKGGIFNTFFFCKMCVEYPNLSRNA